MKQQRIVVIGSGFGGLGAARARLAASGHRVTLVEQLGDGSSPVHVGAGAGLGAPTPGQG